MKRDIWLTLTLALLAVLALADLDLLAAPGDVDLTFNPGLRVNDYVYAVAAQADGKVIIGGLFTSPRTLISRLNTNGTVDTNFFVGTGANGIIYSMAVQTDGKIVLGGAFTKINGVDRNRIARLNTDGTLDLGFDPGTGVDGRIRSVALQSNGKVLIGGDFFEVNQILRVRIARLNSNGSVDETFDPGNGADEEVFSVVPQPDGKILVGGYFLNIHDTARNFIARLNSNGTVDDGFDPGGGADLDVDCIALQADGKVVIGGGFGSVNGYSRGRVARLNTDGSVDEEFDPGLGADFHVSAIRVQTDGKIIVGGNFGSFNGIPRSNIVRLNTNGGVDGSFDPGNGADGGVYSVALQGNNLFLGGAFRLINGATRNYIARLKGNGSVDESFNSNTGADYPVLAIAQSTNGKILMGGYFSTVGAFSRNHIARLESDGSLDMTFNSGLGADNRVTSIAALSNGKSLIGGLFNSFNGTNRGRFARLNTDGQLDLTFNSGTGANGDVLSVAVAPEEKTVIVGDFTMVNGTNRARVARLNADGSVDASFNATNAANLSVRCVAVQSDGKVVIGGDFTLVDGVPRNRIARLNTDGKLDMTFNPGVGANATVESVAMQGDGKIILGGQFTSVGGTNRVRVARLNANGAVDPVFNPGADGFVLSVAVHSDGKILLGGDFFSVSGVPRIHVARLKIDGALDADFNPGSGANDSVNVVAFQSDGKALVGGFFNTINGIGRSSIARLEGDLPRPSLTIVNGDHAVLTSWPGTFTNFTLQTTTDCAQTNSWSNVALPPSLVGGRWVVTNTTAGSAKFFRLRSL